MGYARGKTGNSREEEREEVLSYELEAVEQRFPTRFATLCEAEGPFHRGPLRPSEIPDIYTAVHNSKKL